MAQPQPQPQSCFLLGGVFIRVLQFLFRLPGRMLSPREFNCAILYARLACATCAINASWNRHTKFLQPASGRKSFLCHLITCLIIWILVNSAWRVYESVAAAKSGCTPSHSHTANATEVAIQAGYTLLMLIYATMLLQNLAFASLVWSPIGLFNQLLICTRRLGVSDPPGTKREKHVVALQIMYFLAVLSSSLIITATEAYHAYTTRSSKYLQILTPIASFIVVWAVCIVFGLLQMYLFFFYAIVKATLVCPRVSSSKGSQGVKAIETAIQHYKGVYILCSWFNHGAFCQLVVPSIKYGDSVLAMFFMLVAVRMLHMDSVHPLLPAIFIFIAIYVYLIIVIAGNLAGSFWKMSHVFIENLRRNVVPRFSDHEEQRYLKRAVKSLHHLRFSVGGAYYMEKKAKLTLAGTLIKGTGKLIIAFK